MMDRYECLKLLASDLVDDETLVVTSLSTNTSVFSSIRERGAGFYGLNMGLCTPFALGVSLAFPKRKVLALDSDGSLMIDTSALITVADADPKNLVIVVFDNQAYARMGPTFTARRTDLEKMAQGAGIAGTATVRSMDDFSGAVARALSSDGPTFIVAKVETETVRARANRPRRTYGHAMRETFVEQTLALPDHYAARAGG